MLYTSFHYYGTNLGINNLFSELLPEPSPTCNHVISVINERISERVCTNEIIFEDDFSDGIDFKKWKADHFIPTNSKVATYLCIE